MKDCKIVQDLLPSYIENLTSKDTNEYVEGHLKTCEDCTSVYNNMKADLKANVTSPKAEIDYMKKVRKKMKIAEKLLYIVLLLFIIFVLVFWREIFSFICYTDICNRYLEYQEDVFEAGNYTITRRENQTYSFSYRTPEKGVQIMEDTTDGTKRITATILNSNIEDTIVHIMLTLNEEGKQEYPALVMYNPPYDEMIENNPCYPSFDFDRKSTFWELMSTFAEIRNIRIVDDYYEIDVKESDTKYYLSRGSRFEVKNGPETISLKVGEVTEEDLNIIDFENGNMYFFDYEMPNRNTSRKIEKKISNCDQEAGTVVSYDFKITKDDNTSLAGLKEDNTNKNLLMAKITNNITYKKFQEKWSGLRDMTDEDFINYSAIIVVNKDNTKEIHYSAIEENEEAIDQKIKLTEENSISDFVYSATLIIVPNTMDGVQTPYHIGYYNAEIINN